MLPDDVAYDRAHGCSCATALNAARGRARAGARAAARPAGFARAPAPGLHYRGPHTLALHKQGSRPGPAGAGASAKSGRRRGRRLQAGLVLGEKSDDVRMLPIFRKRHRCLAVFVFAVDISTISQQKPGHFDVTIPTPPYIADAV